MKKKQCVMRIYSRWYGLLSLNISTSIRLIILFNIQQNFFCINLKTKDKRYIAETLDYLFVYLL